MPLNNFLGEGDGEIGVHLTNGPSVFLASVMLLIHDHGVRRDIVKVAVDP